MNESEEDEFLKRLYPKVGLWRSLKQIWRMFFPAESEHEWVSSDEEEEELIERLTAADPDKLQLALDRIDQDRRERLGDNLREIFAHKMVRLGDEDKFPRWSFHCCIFDRIDRAEGAPPRIHIHTPWRFITICLKPGDSVGRMLDQDRSFFELEKRYLGFIWVEGYRRHECAKIVRLERDSSGRVLGYYECPRKKGHTGPCYSWKDHECTWVPILATIEP